MKKSVNRVTLDVAAEAFRQRLQLADVSDAMPCAVPGCTDIITKTQMSLQTHLRVKHKITGPAKDEILKQQGFWRDKK